MKGQSGEAGWLVPLILVLIILGSIIVYNWPETW